MELQTERLYIANLSLDDSEFIMKLVNTPGWLKFIGDSHIHSISMARKYIQAILGNPNIDYWAVRLKVSNQPVGIVTFIKKDHLDHPDIGFAFLPAFESNGYAKEATLSVLNQLAADSKFSTILAVTNQNNDSSIKLLKKLGLTYSHEIEVNRKRLNVYEASSDLFLINNLSNHFFSAFENTNGRKIQLDFLKTICVPETVIYTKKEQSYTAVNLTDFITVRQKILTDGTIINFHEKEVQSKTIISGNIAQRHAEYQKSGELNGNLFTQRGTKLFQFIKNNGKWNICSLIWEDDKIN